MASMSDKLVGALLMLIGIITFSYYSTWIFIIPYLSPNHSLLRYFPSYVWALRIPIILLVLGASAVGGFISWVLLKAKSKDLKKTQYAIAVKSGGDIMLDRTPLLFITYLQRIRNKIIIGEKPGVQVGSIPMLDVYTHLYDGLRDEDNSALTFKTTNYQRTEVSKLDIAQRIPNEDSEGWKADAHKNLPGFRELWSRFPNAEWFMMVDDDTYVMLDNLDHFLSNYNSSLPYYFGAANTFAGCDEITNFGYSTLFAHGGSGILVSRGAMQRLETLWEFCIIRYHDCWAGDVRLALCLRNAGVLITNLKTFHTNAPNENTVFSYPCARPITFHHLLLDQVQKLYIAEKNNGGVVTMEMLLKDWMDERPRKDTTRNGDEIAVYETSTIAECTQLCSENVYCVAYKFSTTLCTLQSKVNMLQVEEGTTSGLVFSNFNCNSPSKVEEAEEAMVGA